MFLHHTEVAINMKIETTEGILSSLCRLFCILAMLCLAVVILGLVYGVGIIVFNGFEYSPEISVAYDRTIGAFFAMVAMAFIAVVLDKMRTACENVRKKREAN